MKLIVLTGAGMSAESGIQTFRDAGGLWENHRIEDVATPEGWMRNPELVLDFYNTRRRQLFNVQPNGGHIALAEMEKYFDVQIVTQNVDNLHEKAGSTKVLHLHGELMKVRSTGTGEIYNVNTAKPDTHIGDRCPHGFQLRPHIVWFGEAVPEMDNAANLANASDMMLVIGTSLNVYPAANLLYYAPKGIPIYLIDPVPATVSLPNLTVIKSGASEGMRIFREKYMKL